MNIYSGTMPVSLFANGLEEAPQTSSSISLHVNRDSTRLGRASSKPARNANACGANSEARNLAKRARYSPRFWLVTGQSKPVAKTARKIHYNEAGHARGWGGKERGSDLPRVTENISNSANLRDIHFFSKISLNVNCDSIIKFYSLPHLREVAP